MHVTDRLLMDNETFLNDIEEVDLFEKFMVLITLGLTLGCMGWICFRGGLSPKQRREKTAHGKVSTFSSEGRNLFRNNRLPEQISFLE
eukprot:snap_masked-scaffold_7-processed-gene-12.7-mRNA-1 protein AED:1.00 eAED:1.00 QI:0/-1/0/0/-1/1/1/0/87